MTQIAQKTKAEMLCWLREKISKARILDSFHFETIKWKSDKPSILDDIESLTWFGKKLIVRSSSKSEDLKDNSNAGKYASYLNVVSREGVIEAIEGVIRSYGNSGKGDDQILIQPMLEDVIMNGVVFSQEPNLNAPYIVINYALNSDTTAVTSGKACSQHTLYVARSPSNQLEDGIFQKLVEVVYELENELENEYLDIEFAVDSSENIYIFQVRNLIVDKKNLSQPKAVQSQVLKNIQKKIENLSTPHPYLHGNKTILGIMPDWNPAEIIGIRPKPLALSLYKELITDRTWAYQRDNYGYKNLRSFPLLIDLEGLPYIDVRVSFNSFIPKELDAELSDRLVNYYLGRLETDQHLHDKVEFDITYSCYTFDIEERIQQLQHYGFSLDDRDRIIDSLRSLTNNIIHRDRGLWVNDTKKIEELKKRNELICFNNSFDELTKVFWLIEDCKRYGTLPFAGLARAGFIAVQILNSMVAVGVLTPDQKLNFLNSLDSVSTQMTRDIKGLDREHFLQKYGHLRPGTYDILSPRYDEAPNLYFDWKKVHSIPAHEKVEFQLSLGQLNQIEKLLIDHKLEHDVVGLFSFIKSSIEGREYSKFLFTKTLSDILSLLKVYSSKVGLTVEDMAFVNIQDILRLYTSSSDPLSEIEKSISSGKEKFNITNKMILPPLIVSATDIYSFQMPENRPNFVTKKSVTASVLKDLKDTNSMTGAVLFIPSADPGFDWIFTHNIAGFVTAHGGINSHMAIRAGELGLPAVIGAGEKLYSKWINASKLHIDCLNQRVEEV